MITEFLLFDDSINFKLQRTSITGILVETSKVEKVRKLYFEIVSNLVYPSKDSINLSQLDLHASDLFKGTKNENNDTLKFAIFNGFVEIVNQCKLGIKRISIINKRKQIQENFINIDDKFLKLLIHHLLLALKEDLNSKYLIPVFDGLSNTTSEIISSYFRNISLFRHSTRSELIYKGTENILGEVFYSNRKNSILIQLPDFIGYLLMIKDNSLKTPLTKFQDELVKISGLIDPNLLDDINVEYEINKN